MFRPLDGHETATTTDFLTKRSPQELSTLNIFA